MQEGISGSWIIQADGQGAMINIADANGTSVFVVTWYAYLNGEQVWLIGSASIPENSSQITVPVQISNGAGFGANFMSTDVTRTDWGNLTFNFSTCNTGTLQYSSNLPGYGSGSLSLTRLTNTKGLVCQEQNVPTAPTSSLGLTVCVDDFPQAACTLLDEDEGDSQFVLGSSCSSSFPQLIYLNDLDPGLKNSCSTGGFENCGACGFDVPNTAKSTENIKNIDIKLKNIDIDLIKNIVHESFVNSQNNPDAD